MNIEKHYQEWNENLRQEYCSIFPNASSIIWDGVVDSTSYYNSPLKLMFINKESPDKECYNLSAVIREQILNKELLFQGYGNFKKSIMRETALFKLLENGDIKNITPKQVERALDGINDRTFSKQFAECAICNIKKCNGKKYSSAKDLRMYLNKGKKILEAQIDFFNPSIIIGGNVCDNLLESYFEWGENLYAYECEKSIKIYQIEVNGKLFPYFDLYHPSAFGKYSIDKTYCLRIWDAIQKVEQEEPHFWDKTLHRRCFGCYD